MFSCEICEIFKNTYFEEHLPWLLILNRMDFNFAHSVTCSLFVLLWHILVFDTCNNGFSIINIIWNIAAGEFWYIWFLIGFLIRNRKFLWNISSFFSFSFFFWTWYGLGKIKTTWKMSQFRGFSGPYFHLFRMNTLYNYSIYDIQFQTTNSSLVSLKVYISRKLFFRLLCNTSRMFWRSLHHTETNQLINV